MRSFAVHRTRGLSARSLLIITFVLTAACGGKKSGPSIVLVSPAEARALKAWVLKEARRHQQQRCPRPVLRGKASSGSAGQAIAAVLDPSKARQACEKTRPKDMKKLFWAQHLDPDLVWDPLGANSYYILRPLGDPQAETALTGAIVKGCRPWSQRVRQAVRFGDACSPYRAGVRGEPNGVKLVHLGLAAGLIARDHLMAGRIHAGVQLMLDLLRLSQDIQRGGSGMSMSMIGHLFSRPAVATVEQVLNMPPGKGRDATLYRSIRKELTLLLASEPHPLTLVNGDRIYQAFHLFLPHLMPEGWRPKGGWGEDGPMWKQAGGSPTSAVTLPQVAEMSLLALKELGPAIARACPKSAPPLACDQGLRKLRKKVMASAGGTYSKTLAAAKKLLGKKSRPKTFTKKLKAEARAITLKLIKVMSLSGLVKYLPRLGHRGFALAALRLSAAYRELAEQRRDCPTLADFRRAPLKALSTDPYSGRPMRIQRATVGRFIILPAAPFRRQMGVPQPPAITIDCPY